MSAAAIRNKGFTLVEMVMTIVIAGIIVLGITGFIELGFGGYVDTIARQKAQNQARFVLEKMSREISHAVPNSFELTSGDKCLTFYPIRYSGFYTQDELNSTIQFMVDNQGATALFSSGDRLVINPSQIEDLDSTSSASVSVEDCDTNCSENNGIYTIDDDFSSHSIASRHYIYSSDSVTYCMTSGAVTRSQGGSVFTVADSIVLGDSGFSYEQTSLQRGGLVHIDLMVENNEGEQSSYKHDVQVLNVP